MVVDLAGPILELVARYGLAALFLFLLLDAAMLLPLVPGEIMLIWAVHEYATSWTAFAAIVLFASAASTTGNLVMYGIARGGGRRFFEKYPRLFLMSPRRRDRLEHLFQRPLGQSLVLFLRLFPVLRLVASIPAGLARMPAIRYVILTFLGNLLFHAGFMYIAYESRRPGSAVSYYTTIVQHRAADPAWDYVQTNWLLTGLVVLALGIVLSLRASAKAMQRPREPWEGSLLGTLANLTLFWGGVAILASLWIEPDLLYSLIGSAGFSLEASSYRIPYAPLSVLVGIGAWAVTMSLLMSAVRRHALRGHKAARESDEFRKKVKARIAPQGRPR